MKSEHDDEKVLEGYYAYIGKHHVENSVKVFDDLNEKRSCTAYPDELHSWFNAYLSEQIKKEQRNKDRVRMSTFSKRVAVFLLIFVTGIAITTMSVEAFRVKIFNIVTEVTEKYTAIHFTENDLNGASSIMAQWDSYYEPQYIPKGYALVDAKGSGTLKIMYFSNESNDRIEFSQASIDANLQVDTEGASIEDIEINGAAGIFVKKEDLSILLWATDKKAFYILGTLDKETFLNIAESIELK
ncbi:DUF4367 domain-containing protein [Fusibacter sp. 3D3]|uniref:DUF4367 domain-containing protein n=1 Tax=Fusibacter sp. 3D3 TaxID=1048380 RepID=UPI000853C9B0|nr:DUF4367 domain-containing protein [Fusibacter sp. 3D3]GAU75869.1 outer membrane lipoprotein-sorting protein [Fusibacter sp. 3D3]